MKKIYLILHYISKINSYLLCFFVLFFIQNYTIGLILKIIIKEKYCYMIYTILSILFIKNKINISSPYEKYLN